VQSHNASLGCEGADLKGGIAMGGRLDFMSGHEYAISALLEDLPVVEQHVASGGRLGELDVRDLRDIHARIARLLGAIDHKPVTDPAMQDIPLPTWRKSGRRGCRRTASIVAKGKKRPGGELRTFHWLVCASDLPQGYDQPFDSSFLRSAMKASNSSRSRASRSFSTKLSNSARSSSRRRRVSSR
jgi:hypothetical protein